MSDDADYEPAIDAPAGGEASPEAEPVIKRGTAAAEVAEKIGSIPEDAIDAPPDPGIGPRAPRVWSGKSRAAFRAVVAKGGVGEEAELEPMGTEDEPPAAPVAKPAPVMAPPALAAPAAPTAPVTPPPGLPALPDLPLPAAPAPAAAAAAPDAKHAEREAQIAARESALVEREKLLPDRTAFVERPARTMLPWIRDVWGIAADDKEGMRSAIADFVTELSEEGLEIRLPDDVKAPLESRRAVRSIKAYRATIDRDRASLAEQRAAQEKASAEAKATEDARRTDAAYVARIGELIAPAAAQFPYLHDSDLTEGARPNEIVYDVMKEQKAVAEQWKKENPGHPLPEGMGASLATATAFANSYYEKKANALLEKAARIKSKLAPTAPAPVVATPAAATSPGGAPGPAPKSPPPAPPAMEWDPSDLPMDRQQRRKVDLHARLQKATAKVAAKGQ